MQLFTYKYGSKAFIMTVMTSFILLMLLALMFLYSYSHKPLSSSFFEANTISSLSFAFENDLNNVFQTNFSYNSSHYLIQERFFQGKAGNVSNRLSSYSLLISKISTIINSSLSFDFAALNYSNINASAVGIKYVWDYPSDKLVLNGSYSHLVFNFSNSSVINDNCTNIGAIFLEINAGDYFSKNLSFPCTISLNFSGNVLNIDFDGQGFIFDYSSIPSISHSLLIRTDKTSGFKHYLNHFQADTSSTTNPGFTEPSYPSGTNAVKHYGTVSLYGVNYNLIVIDYNNDSYYDAVFIDADSNFSNSFMKTNASQIFLNSRGFLITISQDGNSVSFDNVLSLYYYKEKDKKMITW